MTCDLEAATLKIDQLAFIRDLLEEKSLAEYNSVNITMKLKASLK